MPSSTTRLALLAPLGADAVSEYRLSTTNNATKLDGAVIITEGTLASRPTTSLVYGQTYYATDTGLWYFYDGTAWHTVLLAGQPLLTQVTPPGSITAAYGTHVTGVIPTAAVTLPGPGEPGQIIAITTNGSVNGASPVYVQATSIYVPGAGAVTEFLIGAPLASVMLIDCGTHYEFLAGEQDTGWVPLTLPSGIVASGTPTATPSARLRGNEVELSGTLNPSTGSWSAGTTFATVAASMIPQYSPSFVFAADTPMIGFVGEAGGGQPGQLQMLATTFTVCSLDGLRYRVSY